MTMPNRDQAYLWDMLDAARDVLSFVDNLSYHDYGDIKVDRIWAVAKNKLPELINSLENLIQ